MTNRRWPAQPALRTKHHLQLLEPEQHSALVIRLKLIRSVHRAATQQSISTVKLFRVYLPFAHFVPMFLSAWHNVTCPNHPQVNPGWSELATPYGRYFDRCISGSIFGNTRSNRPWTSDPSRSKTHQMSNWFSGFVSSTLNVNVAEERSIDLQKHSSRESSFKRACGPNLVCRTRPQPGGGGGGHFEYYKLGYFIGCKTITVAFTVANMHSRHPY